MFSTPVTATNSARAPMITIPTLELVNISSSLGEEFEVEHLSLPELEDRFRIAPNTASDKPSAFMGAAGATLFVQNNNSGVDTEHVVDTRGSVIENELMDLLDEVFEISSLTFIGSSEDEADQFFGANFANVERNSYGRPVQRVQPSIRQSQTAGPNTNPPVFPSQNSAFTTVIPTPRWAQEPTTHSLPQANYFPMPVPFYPNNWNNVRSGRHDQNVQMSATYQNAQNTTLANNQPILQMNTSVMPEVAGYCPGCSKTYDQIAVETLTNYVAWSEYPEETIRDRNVRSRAFVDGFEAALICFKKAGLSPGFPCEMSGVQHR